MIYRFIDIRVRRPLLLLARSAAETELRTLRPSINDVRFLDALTQLTRIILWMVPFVVSSRPSICGQRLQDSHVLRAPSNTSKGARCFCNYRPCKRCSVMGGVMSPSLQNRAIIVQVAMDHEVVARLHVQKSRVLQVACKRCTVAS